MNKQMRSDAEIGAVLIGITIAMSACAHTETTPVVAQSEAARLDRVLVRNAVVFDPGTENGAVVPDVSAPSLHAIWVEEHREGNRLIEGHREWLLDGQIVLLGIPKQNQIKQGGQKNDEATTHR